MQTETWSTFFALLTVAAELLVVGAVIVAIAGRLARRAHDAARALRDWIRPAALPFAWVVAVVATSGSLYFSEIAGFIPCKLCWYQRIAMYPLTLILGIAAVRRDTSVGRYVLPLVTIGGLISAYHYQLERFPQQGSVACSLEAPCTFVWVWRFHYISIPLMALSAFALIATLLVIARDPTTTEEAQTEGFIERERVHV